MSKVKVEVVGGVVDGNSIGSVIEVADKSAKHLASIGYVKIIGKAEAGEKGKSAPKKVAKAKPKKKEVKAVK